jgi:hypothetical protein
MTDLRSIVKNITSEASNRVTEESMMQDPDEGDATHLWPSPFDVSLAMRQEAIKQGWNRKRAQNQQCDRENNLELWCDFVFMCC